MGIFKRLGDVARSNLSDLKERVSRERERPDREPRPLSDMTNQELDAEIERRRKARGTGPSGEAQDTQPDRPPSPAPAPASYPRVGRDREIARCYARLELAEGASLDQVKQAYRFLMERYHPDRHVGDPDAHAAALKLAQSLTRAYAELLAHLDPEKHKPIT